MAQMQWYPGHMAKATREVESRIKLIDIIIELVDARAPRSSMNEAFEPIIKNKPRLIVMTKQDMADAALTSKWLKAFESRGYHAMSVNLRNFNDYNRIIDTCKSILKDQREKQAKRGLKPRAIRAMVIGIPNVGKSTFINALAKRKATVTGNKPGVTKSQQIIKIDKDFELYDTPGILAPKFDDKVTAMNVSLIGSIKKDILPLDDLFIYAIGYLNTHYPQLLKERYDLEFDNDDDWVLPVFDHIAKVRHIPKFKGETNYDRVVELFFKDLYDGLIGRITWEEPHE